MDVFLSEFDRPVGAPRNATTTKLVDLVRLTPDPILHRC